MKNKRPRIFKIISVVLALTMLAFFAFQYDAKAAALSAISDTMSNLNDTEVSNHDIKFRAPTGMSAGTMKIYFNTAAFDDSTVVFGDIDLQYGSDQAQVNGSCASGCAKATLAAAAGAGAWGAVFATNDLTFTYPTSAGTAIAANDYVRVLIGTNAIEGGTGTHQMINPGSTGTKVITIDVAGTTDTGKFAVDIIADDQIPVTASVDPTITFTVANTTLDLGTITSSAIATSSYNNITVGTNAPSGYAITVKDAGNGTNPGLYNTNASKLIASADATPLSTGAEGYGGQCNKVSGSGSCTFTGTSDNVNGFTLAGGAFASYASKPSGTDTFQIRVKGAVSSSTESGAYADTLTLIATATY
jgi:hypothetical protein